MEVSQASAHFHHLHHFDHLHIPEGGGTFLLHFPSDRSAPACLLRDSTGVLPCEVRTFLPDRSRPPPGQLQSYSTRAPDVYDFWRENRHQTAGLCVVVKTVRKGSSRPSSKMKNNDRGHPTGPGSC